MRIKRRDFLIGGLLAAAGLAPLLIGRFRTLEAGAEQIVARLCDVILPGNARSAGALDLGLDRELVADFRQTRRGRLQLLAMAFGLGGEDFLELTADDQRRAVAELLERHAAEGSRAPRTARTVAWIYRECGTRYYASESAWGALGYRVPQPHGYPDYTQAPEV